MNTVFIGGFNMKNNQIEANRKFSIIFFCVFMLSLICIFTLSSYSTPELVSSITIDSTKLSYSDKIQGSFRITKSAQWISEDKVKVTLDLNTTPLKDENGKDIIFVLDVSDTMKNEKILGIQKELKNIINTSLLDSSNRIALVTYSNSSKILSNLTNNQEELNQLVESVTTETEKRNLYQAFLNVERILKENTDHQKDTKVILIMGGYSNIQTSNEAGEYQYLKEQYPNITVSKIQYEAGGNIEKLMSVSDQFFASDRESLKDHLYEALECTKKYKILQMIDFLDTNSFDEDRIQNIVVSDGSIQRDGNQLKWDLNGLASGRSSKLEYVITRNHQVEGELYPISEKHEIRYLVEDIEEKMISTLTPILGRSFEVTYEGNAPSGCNVQNIPEKSMHQVYEWVQNPNDIPSCKGYQFEGWKNVTEGVTLTSDPGFLMPEANITFRAVWSKVTVRKTMDGNIHSHEDATIRKVNHIDTEELWKYKSTIKKIVFEDSFRTIGNAVEVFDLSEEQNGGILAYIVGENGGYTAYIQGDGKITANEDSSYLFDRFIILEVIEGIENLDTSKVTNMSHMFGRCRSLKTMDLSLLDTSNVVDMSYMFHDCISLISGNFRGLATSKVENMHGMFEGCIKLKEVDFTNDDLSHVLDMRDMFKDCPNLERILPEILNIGEMTDTDGIFEGGNLLEEPPIRKEYLVTMNHNTYGTIQPLTLNIAFGRTNTVLVTPNIGYYLEDFSCTNGYQNHAIINSSSSEKQTITIHNNNENIGSICNATFRLATYKIVYNLDGGTIEGEYPTTYTMESSLITLKNPTRTGYDFIGWTTPEDETPQMKVTIPKGSTGNRSYTAHWTPKQYTVTINKTIGGTTSTSSLMVPYGNSNTLTVVPNPGYYLSDISCTNGYTASAKTGKDEMLLQEITISNNQNDQSSTCIVSFGELLLTEYLISLAKADTTNLAYDDTVDQNLRYIGANPNNYVQFNHDLWRVIGVMNHVEDANGNQQSHVKLIRAESIGNYSWDNKLSGTGSSTSSNGSNDWGDATLKEILNQGLYWNRASGTCSSGKNGAVIPCDFTNIGLTTEAKKIISNISWNLGGHSTYEESASTLYKAERESNAYSGRPTTWQGYVGLIYPSDYGYAVGGSVRSLCLSQNLHTYNENNCKENNWIFLTTTEWTISPRSDHAYYAFNINGSGYLYFNSAFNTYAIRPSVYLNTNVKKTGGTGTLEDPFTIE